jgi:hypothetical protein
MKKTRKTKVALHRETLRRITDEQAASVAGALPTNTTYTGQAGGCSAGNWTCAYSEVLCNSVEVCP